MKAPNLEKDSIADSKNFLDNADIFQTVISDDTDETCSLQPIPSNNYDECNAVDEENTLSDSQKACVQLTSHKNSSENSAKNRGLWWSIHWIQKSLLPRLAVWSGLPSLNTKPTSLVKISVERYNDIYNQLKLRYAKKLIEVIFFQNCYLLAV